MEPKPSLNTHNTPSREIHLPNIKAIGLGGAGCNTINHIMELKLPNIECISANTDVQVLQNSLAPIKIQLGPILTRGLGSGGDPHIGEKAAEESYREITTALEGADMVFLTAGMGGGTGTGASPIAARIARSLGAVVISIVSTPFSFESGKRQSQAREGLASLRPSSDTLIVVPNDRLLQVAPIDLPLEMAFRLSDDVLRQAIQSISELISQTGLINIDFAHIMRIMRSGGGTFIGIGNGQGEHKVTQALEEGLNHPLLENIDLKKARNVIVNFTASGSLTMNEVVEALNHLREQCHPDVEIIPGIINNPMLQDRVQVIIIVTGMGSSTYNDPVKAAAFIQLKENLSEPEPKVKIPQSLGYTTTKQEPKEDLEVPAFIRKHLQLTHES